MIHFIFPFHAKFQPRNPRFLIQFQFHLIFCSSCPNQCPDLFLQYWQITGALHQGKLLSPWEQGVVPIIQKWQLGRAEPSLQVHWVNFMFLQRLILLEAFLQLLPGELTPVPIDAHLEAGQVGTVAHNVLDFLATEEAKEGHIFEGQLSLGWGAPLLDGSVVEIGEIQGLHLGEMGQELVQGDDHVYGYVQGDDKVTKLDQTRQVLDISVQVGEAQFLQLRELGANDVIELWSLEGHPKVADNQASDMLHHRGP